MCTVNVGCIVVTVLAFSGFSGFRALGPFIRVSVPAFDPNLLSERECHNSSYGVCH